MLYTIFDPDGVRASVQSFESPQEAAGHAKSLSEVTGRKHKVGPVPDTGWQDREWARVLQEEYRIPIWGMPVPERYVASGLALDRRSASSDRINARALWSAIPDHVIETVRTHFVHFSTANPESIAFTPDERAGQEDRQIRTTPGRYLQRYFSDYVRETTIHAWAAKHIEQTSAVEVKFARTPRDILRAYRHGPDSCMSKTAGNYDCGSRLHPVECYGNSDLALAYLGNLAERVTARCIVWPEKLRFGRIYGDAHRLEPALQKLGYRAGNFDGARIRTWNVRGRRDLFAAPYLDCSGLVALETDDSGAQWLRLGSESRDAGSATSTSGAIQIETPAPCSECAKFGRVRNMMPVRPNGNLVCSPCLFAEDAPFYECASRGWTDKRLDPPVTIYGGPHGDLIVSTRYLETNVRYNTNFFICALTGQIFRRHSGLTTRVQKPDGSFAHVATASLADLPDGWHVATPTLNL